MYASGFLNVLFRIQFSEVSSKPMLSASFRGPFPSLAILTPVRAALLGPAGGFSAILFRKGRGEGKEVGTETRYQVLL